MATHYGYQKLYELLRDTSQQLEFPVEFNGGMVSEINLFNKEHNKTLMWLVAPTVNSEFINRRRLYKNWIFTFYVYQQDKQDSDNEQKNLIINDCDYVATEYFIRINQHFEENETREFNISSLSEVPIFRAGTEIFTGLECKFTLSLPDDHPYCS